MDSRKRPTNNRELQNSLNSILADFLDNNGIEIAGNLTIEVADLDVLALVKGSTIYVNGKARRLPRYILRYIMAHELAHLLIKRHTEKFWEIVRHIYPQYEKGKIALSKRYNHL